MKNKYIVITSSIIIIIALLVIGFFVFNGISVINPNFNTVTIGINAFPKNLDPSGVGTSLNTILSANLFDPLVKISEAGQIQPCIAEFWTESADKKQITFKLREDIKFTNGDVLTADDVVFTINRYLATPLGTGGTRFISKVTKIDEFTVQIDRPTNFSKIYEYISSVYIVPQRIVEADVENFDKNPVGSGAYKYFSTQAGQGYTLEANSNYFEGAPKIKYLKVKTYSNNSSSMIALQTGEIDVVYGVSPTDIKVIGKDANIIVTKNPTYNQYQFQIMKGGQVDNILIRKAIYNAVNAENALIIGYEQFGTVAEDLYAKLVMGEYYKLVPMPSKDIELSKTLLKEANYDSTKPIMITVIDPVSLKIAQSCQSDLAAVGMKIEIEQLDQAAFYKEYMNGNLQVMIIPMGNIYMAPEEVVNLYTTTGDPYLSYTGKSKNYDTLVSKILIETDQIKKTELMKDALTELKNNYLLVPLFEVSEAIAYRSRLENVKAIAGNLDVKKWIIK